MLSLAHIIFLHRKGSSNPLGGVIPQNKIRFHPYFTLKDLLGFRLFTFLLSYLIFFAPYSMIDAENNIEANCMVTPVHIQPEWYFLFAYAILRSVPSKLGGVVALLGSILVLLSLPIKKAPFSVFGF